MRLERKVFAFRSGLEGFEQDYSFAKIDCAEAFGEPGKRWSKPGARFGIAALALQVTTERDSGAQFEDSGLLCARHGDGMVECGKNFAGRRCCSA